MHNILLVYPEFPPSFWGGEFAREFIKKKAAMPPLGLLTVAALFPKNRYKLRLLDLNVQSMTESDLQNIDLVATSTMVVQKDSLQQVINLCNQKKVPVLAGGPHPTTYYEDIPGVSYFALGEVEGYFHKFLADWEKGQAKHIYSPEIDSDDQKKLPVLSAVPLPRYDLIDFSHYHIMCLQYSRGCPFDCEFCDITALYGRVPRVKSNWQVLYELEDLYQRGWRGEIFFVDDNFIGNKLHVIKLLPDIIDWQKQHGYPFSFNTEASLNLVNIQGLPELMVKAGFNMVFIGLETTSLDALQQTNKVQNIDKNQPDFMLQSIKHLQNLGLEVTAGFIVGLDGDNDPQTFNRQIEFIQQSGIATAMVGLLTVIKGTKLYDRYKKTGRILEESSGDNVAVRLNYRPEMNADELLAGYKRVIQTLYSPSLQQYFDRSYILIKNLQAHSLYKTKIKWQHLRALLLSLQKQLFSRQGFYYSRFIFRVLISKPHLLPMAFALAIKGYHFQKITSNITRLEEFESYLETEKFKIRKMAESLRLLNKKDVQSLLSNLFAEIEKKRSRIHHNFQENIEKNLTAFYSYINSRILKLLPIELEAE